ncbi:MAG: hypothetical protein ACR2OU_14970, partial [Thermomicrobiales bacterium]
IGPVPLDLNDKHRRDISKLATDLAVQSPALKHGIDLLRPNETIPIRVGAHLAAKLQDDFALDLLKDTRSPHSTNCFPIRFSIEYQCDQRNGQFNVTLDRMAEVRSLLS